MTLYDIIRYMEGIASAQHTIRMIVENDIWKLDAEPSAEYGVFGFRQTEHNASLDSSIIHYGFELYYVDRLTNDKSNQIEVQSVGVQTLDNIVRAIGEELMVEDYRFSPFYQKFADECSGVICYVTIGAPVNTVCAVEGEKVTVKTI